MDNESNIAAGRAAASSNPKSGAKAQPWKKNLKQPAMTAYENSEETVRIRKEKDSPESLGG